MPPDASSGANGFDKLIHEPARLLLMARLFVVDAADFTFLAQATGLTGGNLSSHMSKLETAGYIEIEKSFVDRRPRTLLRLTAEGREAFRRYRDGLRSVLDELPD